MPADLHDQLDQAAPQRVPDLDFDALWRRHQRSRALRTASGVAITAVLVIVVLSIAPRIPPVTIDPVGPPRDTPSDVRFHDHPALIRQMVDALNARDLEAFIELFAPDGEFTPRGDFHESSSPFGNSQPVADGELVATWLAIVDVWGLEAEILDCETEDGPGQYERGPVVGCLVATRWHTLAMEIHEGWSFEFRGSELVLWNSSIGTSGVNNLLEYLDLDPARRELPLGFDGLEAWESWLEANHPDDAARYLNPRHVPSPCDGCDEFVDSLIPDDPERAARLAPLVFGAKNDWSFDGHDFAPAGLIPYDPAFADEIEASIQTYLEVVDRE